MSDSQQKDAVRELESLITNCQLKDMGHDSISIAQSHLILAAKMIETAGFEIARTHQSEQTIPLLEMSSRIVKISRML